MTTEYEHCKNVTDTTSMCYNGYKQRTFLAQTNSRRDIAMDNLKDTLTTKYAELYWSDPIEKGVAILKPSGGGADDDNPKDDARNPFESGVIDITPATAPPVGLATVYTPHSILTPIFDLRNDANSAAGYNQIRYIGKGQQLVEITARAGICATGTERSMIMSVYKNDKLVDPNPSTDVSHLREIAIIKSTGGDDKTINMELTIQTTVIENDLLKLVLWRTDNSGSVSIKFNTAGLKINTLP